LATIKSIKLMDLHVNTENYRFSTMAGQKDAIDKMVGDQGDKLYNLATHILENGLNPNDKIQVSASGAHNTEFNVLEGNRRIVALKLLNNPDLIDMQGYAGLKKKFRKLHDQHKSKIITDVECIVYVDLTEADKWIKLKHTGQNNGVGTVEWNSQQVQRFEEKVEGKSSIALQAVKMLHSSSDVPREIKENLGNLKITNLDRLISDPDVRKLLGLEIESGQLKSGVAKGEVLKGLAQVAKHLLDPKFNVKKIYTKEDRKKYIKDFPNAAQPDLENKASKSWQVTGGLGFPDPKPGPKKGSKKERRALIPRSCVLQINNRKLDDIYDELRSMHVDDCKNAVAVLFRVFIELSMDWFIEKNNVPKANIDSRLHVKVEEVANYLERNNLATKHICKGIRHAVHDKNNVLGVDTWNAYVHNPRFSPTPQNLMIGWDNIQDFMEKVLGNIK
jgi:hypothetical protein